MIIAIAGPYSAPTPELRRKNLDALNEAAARLAEKGHIPLTGVNAALPVVEKMTTGDPYQTIMDISLAVVERCDALLLLAESPGANRERDLVLSKGGRIFYSIEEVN